MKRKMQTLTLAIICLGFLFLFVRQDANGQKLTYDDIELRIPDSSVVQVLITTDGSTNLGRIIAIKRGEILFKTKYGILTIAREKIKEIKEVPRTTVRYGEYWFPNPNLTRLFFSPTAQMLKQGKGYFAVYYLFFPMIAYGVTDNFTLGGGFSLVPGIDFGEQIFYLTPKMGIISEDKFSLAAGILLINVPDYDTRASKLVGILYEVSTLGKSDNSITLGLGIGFVGDKLADRPMIVIGGERRFFKRLSFVSENWIFPGAGQPLISYGVRFFGEKLSTDFALINTLGEGMIFPGIPYIDFAYNF